MRKNSLLLALLLSMAPALAETTPRPTTEAEALFGRGVEAFEAGRFESAAALLSQAYALEPEARLAFNTALAYERAGRPAEAVAWYRLASEAAEVALRDEAVAAIARLATELPTTTLAGESTPARDASLTVRLEVPVAGSRTRIDGGHALALPAVVKLPQGAHIVEVEAPGQQRWEETITLRAGEVRELAVALVPVRAEVGMPKWWFGAGVTGAATALGVGFYFASASDFERADSLAAEGTDRVGFDRAQADGRAAGALSNASYGIAGIGALATGLLWWLERDDRSEVAVVPILGSSEAGLIGVWRP